MYCIVRQSVLPALTKEQAEVLLTEAALPRISELTSMIAQASNYSVMSRGSPGTRMRTVVSGASLATAC